MLSPSFVKTPPQSVRLLICPDSPAGRLTVGLTEDGTVCRIAFGAPKGWKKEWPETLFVKTAETLPFEKLREKPVVLVGTAFQHKVWRALLRIPPGWTETYAGVAKRIGNPAAMRAVGGACGKNPVPVLVPCHRVVAASGKLGGFGGGLALKKRLLNAEKQA